MNSQISRRDFLKASALLPLTKIKLPVPFSLRQDHQGQTPNVLLLVFDALSAQHMSLYGYPRETTPNITQFAQQATVFHSHHASGNFTSPTTASMLTGVHPWTHRAFNHSGALIERFTHQNIFSLLPPSVYKFAYTHNSWVSVQLDQFEQYLDTYIPLNQLTLASLRYSDILFPNDPKISYRALNKSLFSNHRFVSSLFLNILHQAAIKILGTQYQHVVNNEYPRGIPSHDRSTYFLPRTGFNWLIEQVLGTPSPFFGYVHFLPPHEPYNPRKDFIGIFDDKYQPASKPQHFLSPKRSEPDLLNLRRQYDEYLADIDTEFGRLVEIMRANGSLDNTVFIFTSDHGELFERGIQGHTTPVLYEPLLHIPLVIHNPGQTTRQDIYTHTSNIDLLPTLLEIFDQPTPWWAEGQALPPFNPKTPSSNRPIYALEATRNHKHRPLSVATTVIIQNNYKLIQYQGYKDYSGVFELYDIHNDPKERENLIGSLPKIAAELQNMLNSKLGEVDKPYQN